MSLLSRLRRIPAKVIGLVYLAAIPFFGLIYRGIWTDFYQATARYELATEDSRLRSRRELQSFLDPWFRAFSGNNFRFRSLEAVDVSMTGDVVTFVSPVTFEILSDGSQKRKLFRHLWDMGAQTDSTQEAGRIIRLVTLFPSWKIDLESEEFEMKGIPLALWQGGQRISEEEAGVAMEKVISALPHLANKYRVDEVPQSAGISTSVSGRLRIPDHLKYGLYKYGRAAEGFPGQSFVRFFYFSAVTITTLGYGDIVPMTDRARLLVAIEAILGIVLAGLFLNSVAGGNRPAPNPGPPADV